MIWDWDLERKTWLEKTSDAGPTPAICPFFTAQFPFLCAYGGIGALMARGLGFGLGKTDENRAVFRLAEHTFVPICVLELLFLLKKHQ